jgi:hypothetical protein
MPTDKNIDKKNIDPEDRNPVESVFLGNRCTVPKPVKICADDSIAIEGNSNAGIEISRDFPQSLASGYGARAHHKCSTIDIVAGRVSKYSKSGFFCDNSFEHDAARIYVSEKTDIDKNFNIKPAPNWSLSSIGRAAIGIKADNVRIIGNEGVRIVTGVYKHNTRGSGTAPTATPAGIELIALNTSEKPFDVQPFVKGLNTQALFKKTLKAFEAMCGLMQEFILYQTNMNNTFQEHDHIYAIGDKAHQTCTPCLGLPDPFVEICNKQNMFKDKIVGELIELWDFINSLKEIYLEEESKDFICSLYNGVN